MKRTIAKLVAILFVLVTLSACGDARTDESQEPAPEHFYDNAEIKPVMNGDRSEKIGEYSVVSVLSDEMTEDALEDWYFNYVAEHNYNWCMILYADKENFGVYAISGMVQVDVKFDVDEYGDYSVGDSSGAKFYGPSDGKLVALWQDEKNTETEEPKIATEYTLDDLADLLEENLNQGQENLQYRIVSSDDGFSVVFALKQFDCTADEIAEMFANNEAKWTEVQDSVFSIYNSVVDYLSGFGYYDTAVNVLLVSDADINEVYFAILDGDVVLDCVNDS